MSKRTTSTGALPARVLVVHGPNLNLLGVREPEIYGQRTLEDVDAELEELGAARGLRVECFQSNHEGHIVDRLHTTLTDGTAAVLLNPGGLTHTSVVLRDAVRAISTQVPVIEVHLSIPEARETFRHVSLVAGVVAGRVSGFGADSYAIALEAVARRLRT